MVRVQELHSVDSSECDREPIHIPGSIQPHGFLVAVEESSLTISHASENIGAYLRRPLNEVLDQPASLVFGSDLVRRLTEATVHPLFIKRSVHLEHALPDDPTISEGLDLMVHRQGEFLILEGERAASSSRSSIFDLQSKVELIVSRMERMESAAELCRLAAAEVRELAGFDRALIYCFDEDWNGKVVAEDRNDHLPSYLEHWFPASDIPQQARELYRLNRIRLIATSDYRPVRIIPSPRMGPATPPLNLSLSAFRSVSPIHLEYMRNMGTASSFSISIMRGDRLWGLISCHHHEPKIVSFGVRSAAELVGQVFSLQLAAREQNERFAYRLRLQSGLTQMLGQMTQTPHFAEALGLFSDQAMALTSAAGLAVVTDETCVLRGQTPDEADVRALGAWLVGREEPWESYHADSLSREFPPAQTYAAVGSGILAVSISRVHTSLVIWFRPELVQTITWGGDPRKAPGPVPERLHPRKSFEAWREVVRGRSSPWRIEEMETAREFRHALVAIVLKRAEELVALTEELTKANKELAAFSYSISHDLRAPFRHIRSYAEILQEEKKALLDPEANEILDRILEASGYAGTLVDNLLAFAKMGRMAVKHQPLRMDQLVSEVRNQVLTRLDQRRIEWRTEGIANVSGDAVLIRQVWSNLIENAVKYTRGRDPALIEISSKEDATHFIYSVKDNGAGFDMRYVDKLFGVFQRLHRSEEFEGTGIGLANVRRIVERHGGKTWAEGRRNEGATFYFSLPKEPFIEHAQAHSSR